jgi:hypothetical protein
MERVQLSEQYGYVLVTERRLQNRSNLKYAFTAVVSVPTICFKISELCSSLTQRVLVFSVICSALPGWFLKMQDSEDIVWSQQQLRYWTPPVVSGRKRNLYLDQLFLLGPTRVGSRIYLFQFYIKAEPGLASVLH